MNGTKWEKVERAMRYLYGIARDVDAPAPAHCLLAQLQDALAGECDHSSEC